MNIIKNSLLNKTSIEVILLGFLFLFSNVRSYIKFVMPFTEERLVLDIEDLEKIKAMILE